jgi:ADP-ribosylglycohydrolase
VAGPDTVPFALWCAAQHLDDYEAALWLTVSGLGDRDTTCAIVGGIVALFTGTDGIPAEWRHAREPLPDGIRR